MISLVWAQKDPMIRVDQLVPMSFGSPQIIWHCPVGMLDILYLNFRLDSYKQLVQLESEYLNTVSTCWHDSSLFVLVFLKSCLLIAVDKTRHFHMFFPSFCNTSTNAKSLTNLFVYHSTNKHSPWQVSQSISSATHCGWDAFTILYDIACPGLLGALLSVFAS